MINAVLPVLCFAMVVSPIVNIPAEAPTTNIRKKV